MTYMIEKGFTAAQIAQITGGKLIGTPDPARMMTVISMDSREHTDAGLFVCLKGDRFDGHDFAQNAVENGAVCLLTERDVQSAGACEIRVENTERALGSIAAAYLDRMETRVVAVTGSVGKTTTKQFIYSVLERHAPTHKTEGNFNNQIGLPLTVFGLRSSHRAAVLEMGMNHRGEIEKLSRIARPHIAVITNIGSSHIEYLGSREGIRDAKMEITAGLRPDGKLLLNGDEPLLRGVPGALYVAFDNPDAQYRITDVRESADGSGTDFSLICPDGVLHDLHIPAIGRHLVFDAAVAAAVGLLSMVTEDEIRSGLSGFSNTGMRQKIYDNRGVTVIEDCYNASPESMKAAIGVLTEIAAGRGGRKIAILGDMRELGDYSPALHKEVGNYVAEMGVDVLFTFGEEAVMIAVGAVEGGVPESSIHIFRDETETEHIGNTLKRTVSAGDTVLFKASRALELERLIPFLNS